MIAALLPLVPLLAQFVPRIAEWIGGDDAGDVASQVVGVVQAVAGGTSEAALAAAMADPDKRADLMLRMAEIAATRERTREEQMTARIVAQLADVADARRTSVELARAGHPTAYMPAIVTFLLFAVFTWTLWHLFRGNVATENRDLAVMVVGSVVTAFGSAYGYWIGSSSGSAAKDDRLNALTSVAVNQAAAAPPPSAQAASRPLVPPSEAGEAPARRLFRGG